MNAKQQLAMYVLAGVAAYWVATRVIGVGEGVIEGIAALPGRAWDAVTTGTQDLSDGIATADPVDVYPYGRNADGTSRLPEQVAAGNLELLKAQYPWLFGWL